MLTLQVIGELILSLSPEESAQVFPNLYLPIVEEANRRIWEPYRAFLPTPGLMRGGSGFACFASGAGVVV